MATSLEGPTAGTEGPAAVYEGPMANHFGPMASDDGMQMFASLPPRDPLGRSVPTTGAVYNKRFVKCNFTKAWAAFTLDFRSFANKVTETQRSLILKCVMC